MTKSHSYRSLICLASLLALGWIASGCSDSEPPAGEPQIIPATVMTIEPQDTPVAYEFVGQAESSRQVEIRARVDGFLDKQTYNDGELVQEGKVLFELDKKPLQATLQQVKGELTLHQARHATALANLRRIKPLAEQDPVSKKDLDDAIGAEKETKAAVLAAEGSVREAELNLGYATIFTPVTGLASKAAKQEGSYIPTGQESLLTYVAQLDPIWVNFSISENQLLSARRQEKEGLLKSPVDRNFVIEVVFADGSTHPHKGHVNFAEPNIDPETGTLLIRAELANPEGSMRPGQFVRVLLHGASRPNAITVPQTAVLQGAKGHFVWVLDKEGKAEVRAVQVGPWHGDNWFINSGLHSGDQVVVDNLIKLSQGVQVQNTPPPANSTGTGTDQPSEKTE
ncbi:MAG: efflux RND transporter periplasmic adaptor subunit [Deltaproteobacteria bacterium]|nr:efflux RND transporter periplasmic adaptor subunit [Deltaproteobacteria bacterium]